MSDVWRTLRPVELGILERLLQASFPGADVLRMQLPGIQARSIAGERSIELRVQNQVRSLQKLRVPVEAEYCDFEPYESLGQPHVHLLLHVNGGLMSELQLFKDDGTEILRMPDLSELRVFAAAGSDWE